MRFVRLLTLLNNCCFVCQLVVFLTTLFHSFICLHYIQCTIWFVFLVHQKDLAWHRRRLPISPGHRPQPAGHRPQPAGQELAKHGARNLGNSKHRRSVNCEDGTKATQWTPAEVSQHVDRGWVLCGLSDASHIFASKVGDSNLCQAQSWESSLKKSSASIRDSKSHKISKATLPKKTMLKIAAEDPGGHRCKRFITCCRGAPILPLSEHSWQDVQVFQKSLVSSGSRARDTQLVPQQLRMMQAWMSWCLELSILSDTKDSMICWSLQGVTQSTFSGIWQRMCRPPSLGSQPTANTFIWRCTMLCLAILFQMIVPRFEDITLNHDTDCQQR